MYNVFISLVRGKKAEADPWDGQTLEWSIPSPPPVYNFAAIPVVGSNRPTLGCQVWRRARAAGARGRRDSHASAVVLARGCGVYAIDGRGRIALLVSACGDWGNRHDRRGIRLGQGTRGHPRRRLERPTALVAQTFTPRGHGAAHPPTSLGLDMRKLGMWAFLGSESLFFATLITNFFVNRSSERADYCNGLTYADLAIGLTSVGAFILLMSSLTMVLALAALRDGNRRMYRTWIVSTALLGTSFLCIQIYEFTEFALHGKGMSSNNFRSRLLCADRLSRHSRFDWSHLAVQPSIPACRA